MITDVAGVRCGHWTDNRAMTGCTVILLPAGTVASAEVRGGAPASRELAALDVGRLVGTAHAVVLTGGSAFGLACADGVMSWLEEQGIGFDTGFGVVPIVPTLGIFDLANGDGSVRPGPLEGRSACESATDSPIELGLVGAGTGALIGKWRGAENTRPGGIASATIRLGPIVVSAIVAVNAFGDIVTGPAGSAAGSALDDAVEWLTRAPGVEEPATAGEALTNTTIGLVLTNANLDQVGCNLLAQGAHDGLARAVIPPHTRLDGDAFIAGATGAVDLSDAAAELGRTIDVDQVRLLALATVERAIMSLAP